jgi:hypothetical protein
MVVTVFVFQCFEYFENVMYNVISVYEKACWVLLYKISMGVALNYCFMLIGGCLSQFIWLRKEFEVI